MNERQKRFACRASFLLFCIVPTSLVVSWILRPAKPGPWEDALARFTGFETSVAKVSNPRPNAYHLEDIIFTGQGGGLVAAINAATVANRSGRPYVTVSHLQIQQPHLTEVLDVLHRELIRRASPEHNSTQVIFDRMTIGDGIGAGQTFEYVLGSVRSTKDRRIISVQFVLAGEPIEQRQQLTIESVIAPTEGGEATLWTLDTRETHLPCRLIAAVFPGFKTLGDEAEFTGRIEFRSIAAGWDCEMSGLFRYVDLYRLVNERFHHVLHGTADIVLTHCRFRNGLVEHVAGEVECGEGLIGASLLMASERVLGFQTTRTVAQTEEFRNLKLQFQLDRTQLQLVGLGSNGQIMGDSTGRSLLMSAATGPHSSLDLVRLLVNRSDIQVPMTKETAPMLKWFPAPSSPRPIGLPGNDPSIAPHTTIRLMD